MICPSCMILPVQVSVFISCFHFNDTCTRNMNTESSARAMVRDWFSWLTILDNAQAYMHANLRTGCITNISGAYLQSSFDNF